MDNEAPPAWQGTPADDRRDRRTVLVLAHDPAMRAFIGDAISAQYDVAEAEDVARALTIVAIGPPIDVIVADCFIPSEPRQSSACSDLAHRLYDACPWMPVVMIADTPPASLKAGVLLTGVRAFLRRDFGAADLATTIARVARPRGAAVPNVANVAAIQETFGILDRRLTDMPPLGDLATMADMSRSHFSRTFHAVAGRTLREYIPDLRLKRAHELMRSSRLSLTHIAAESGFYDLPHLDKTFRHRFGLSPTAYRSLSR
jgi:AraC-like DNA-binding protein